MRASLGVASAGVVLDVVAAGRRASRAPRSLGLPNTMPYIRVQCLAVCVNTLPGTGFDPHQNRVPFYFGGRDEGADQQARKSIIEGALETASTLADKDANTLKVFMAPEFLWRGSVGAYEEATIQGLHDELHQLAGTSEFQHWLFVWGSAIGFVDGVDANNQAEVRITNSVLISEGGDNAVGARRRRASRAAAVRAVRVDESEREFEQTLDELAAAPSGIDSTVGGYGLVVSFPPTALPKPPMV